MRDCPSQPIPCLCQRDDGASGSLLSSDKACQPAFFLMGRLYPILVHVVTIYVSAFNGEPWKMASSMVNQDNVVDGLRK